MKKAFLVSLGIFFTVLIISSHMSAQPYYRNAPIDNDLCGLNLSDQQLKEIQKLEFQLDKEIIPLHSELRLLYIKLDEHEMQGDPDSEETDRLFGKIDQIEDSIIQKEIQFHEEVRNLLTEEQKVLFDSYFRYDNALRPGYGRYGCGLGPYLLRGGLGRDSARFGCGYYGYGRGQNLRTWMNEYWRPRNIRNVYGFGYGRGQRRGRWGRFYNSYLYRRRFIR
jgi:hypothetical protein